jgi:hypothetical protein
LAGCVHLGECTFLRTASEVKESFSLKSELADLSRAVEGGDVESVRRISATLLEETQQHASRKVSTLHPTQKHASLQAIDQQKSTCILDDLVFALTPQSKQELMAELDDPGIKEALTWTKSGGWWNCAAYGETCECNGQVRMVDEQHTISSATLPTSAPIACIVENFGGADFRPGFRKQCECSKTSGHFHLHKRLTSTSYLQEIWILLLRFLGRAHLLPAGTGDRLYHGMENWSARHTPGKTPFILEHVWIKTFMKKIVTPHGVGPRCLEWGNPATPGSGFNYANMVPQCTQNVDMQYDAVHWGQKQMGIEGNVVYSDLDNLPRILTTGHDSRLNLIFATQVFEHLPNPHHASKMIFDSLLPGGSVVFTVPQQAQFHLVPHDYFRYTKEGAVHILQQAGFCVPPWTVTSGGDFIFDIARDAGLQVQDFPEEEIEAGFQSGYDKVSDSAITIQILAFKQPHAACAHAMPAIYQR